MNTLSRVVMGCLFVLAFFVGLPIIQENSQCERRSKPEGAENEGALKRLFIAFRWSGLGRAVALVSLVAQVGGGRGQMSAPRGDGARDS